ncbi:MAG: hypothetical protein ABR528_08090 [Pseudonocardiaceae bacterium]
MLGPAANGRAFGSVAAVCVAVIAALSITVLAQSMLPIHPAR